MHQLGGLEEEGTGENVARTTEPHCFARLVAVPIIKWLEDGFWRCAET